MNEYGEVIIYQTDDGLTKLNVSLQNETVWLTIDQMAELFRRDKSTISRHINKIFKEGELVREATVAFFATVQIEGGRKVERDIEYFNLDVIISVGYRVKSKRGTQFRIWANSVLKEYIIKGFAMDDERLKGNGGGNYLKEDELKILNNLVSGYFDLAEINAIEHKPMYMSDYVEQLDSILTSGNRKLLDGPGKVSHEKALSKAKEEYRKYQEITLSPVEEEYMKSIKDVAKEAKIQSRKK